MSISRLLPALALTVYAGSAAAHPGAHEAASFFAGLVHPFGGADHLLAMFAVGLYAARQRGAGRRALPAGFVLAMLAGAALSAAGLGLPSVETGVALSVLVLGLLLAFAVRLPLAAGLPLVSGFALFHGHAHLAEIGVSSLPGYVAGFVAATILLQAAGYAAARRMAEGDATAMAQRAAGGFVAAAGLVLLGA